MSKLDVGPKQEAGPRICLTEGCGTVLSRSNSARICAICSNRLEIGGARIPLPLPTIVSPRSPAPARPVLEGAVPLPGVVKGPERTYAEMIARTKPATAAAVKPRCAECGEPLPKGHVGWLCRLCIAAAAQPVEPAKPTPPARDTQRLETAQTRIPPRAHEHSKADSKPRPGRGRKIGEGRTFDYAEAARIFRETANYSEVARLLGVSHQAATRAVKIEIGDGAAAEISWQAELAGAVVRLLSRAGLAGQCRKCTRPAAASTLGSKSNRWRRLCDEHLEEERQRQRESAARTGFGDKIRPSASASPPSIEKPEPEEPTPVAPPVEDPTPRAIPLDLPPLAELDAELTRLELELDHIAGELGRLYYRQGAATKRMTEVIGLMAQRARSAA